jgi:hypothetical protein
MTNAPPGTSIEAGTAPIDDQQTAFRYVFYLMTALSCVGVLLASRLRDEALKGQGEKAVSGAALPRGPRVSPASQGSEGSGSG